MFLPCGGVHHARMEVIEAVEVKPGQTILETGIGTGDNIPCLEGKLGGGPYYDIDNQLIMLRKCSRNARKWKQDVQLYLADAEELPFRDELFDVVFHLGAFNLFRPCRPAAPFRASHRPYPVCHAGSLLQRDLEGLRLPCDLQEAGSRLGRQQQVFGINS